MADGKLEYELQLDNQQFVSALSYSRDDIARLNTTLRGQAPEAQGASSAVMGLAKSYLALRAAQAAVSLASQSLKVSTNIENEKVRLEVLLGSLEEAESLMDRVLAKAASTPLQTSELQAAARQLIAFGSSSSGVIDELTRLGDISQGVGMSLVELTEIYGKNRVQGKLMGEDINQLAGRGIPIVEELAKVFGVTAGEVRKLVSEGKVGFPEFQQAINNMTNEGGKFAGMMEKMSQTTDGRISTLKDNFEQLIMLPLGDWVKGWVDPLVDGINRNLDNLKAYRSEVQAVSKDFQELQVYSEEAVAAFQRLDRKATEPTAEEIAAREKKQKDRQDDVAESFAAKVEADRNLLRDRARKEAEAQITNAKTPEERQRIIAFQLEEARRNRAQAEETRVTSFADTTIDEYRAMVQAVNELDTLIRTLEGQLEKPETPSKPASTSRLNAAALTTPSDLPANLDSLARSGLFLNGTEGGGRATDYARATAENTGRMKTAIERLAATPPQPATWA